MARTMKELTRRQKLQLLAAGAAGMTGLSGCLGDDDDDPDDGLDPEIDPDDVDDEPFDAEEADGTFWAWGGLNDMRFEKAEQFYDDTGTRINWEHFPFADTETNLRSTFAEDRGPDLASLSVSWVPEFAHFGQLEELTYLDDLDVNLVEGALRNSSHDGDLYCYPWFVDCRMIAINLDAFEEVGISPPDRLERPTWDEFDEWMEAFEDHDDYNGLVMSNEGFEMFWLSNGGHMTDLDDPTDVKINDPEVVNTAEWMLNHVQEDNVALSDDNDEDWLAGVGAMTSHGGSWQFERFNEQATFDWQYVPVPAGPDGDGNSWSWSAGVYYGVPVHAENPEVGHEFGEWLLSDEFQSQLHLLGGEPVTESAYETDEYQQFIDDNPVYETILQEIQYTTVRPDHPSRAESVDISQEAGERVMQGVMEPQESFDDAAVELEQLFAE